MIDRDYLEKGFGLPLLWLDFVNSFESNGLGASEDHLSNPPWRKAFARHWKLSLPAYQRPPMASLVRLRNLLRSAAEQFTSQTHLRPGDLRRLNQTLSVFSRRCLFQHQNGFALQNVPRHANWQWIQAQVAASFAETLVTTPLARIKICPDPLCRWIFYDKTKGKTRIWCNERTCGNRNRVRRSRKAHLAAKL